MVGRIQNCAGNSHLRQESLNKLPRTSVAIRGGDDVSTRRNKREQHGRRRAHTGSTQQSVFPTLELANLLFTRLGRRVTVTTILKAPIASLLVRDQLISVLEMISRRADDRSRQRSETFGRPSLRSPARGKHPMAPSSVFTRIRPMRVMNDDTCQYEWAIRCDDAPFWTHWVESPQLLARLRLEESPRGEPCASLS